MGLRRTFEFITSEDIGAARLGTDEDSDDIGRVLLEWIAKAEEEKALPEAAGSETVSGGSIENGDQRDRDDAAQEDAVFLRSYIPRTLNEVFDPERDVDKLARGEGKDLIYAGVTGIVKANDENDGSGQVGEKKTVKFESEEGEDDEGEDEDEDEDGSDSEDDDNGKTGEFQERKSRGHRHEDKDEKKVNHFIHNTENLADRQFCLGA